MGAYVAAIVMSQLSFEELLRSHYRAFSGTIQRSKEIDKKTFADLINLATVDGWISDEEAQQLHDVRKNYRNSYVHPHDYSNWQTQDMDSATPNFFKQVMKISAPELIGVGVDEEAWQSIRLLVTLFPTVARRFWPIN